MQEMWVRSLGWQDPMEEEVATHFIILAWEIPWTEKPGGLQSVHGVAKSQPQLNDFTLTHSQSCHCISMKEDPYKIGG